MITKAAKETRIARYKDDVKRKMSKMIADTAKAGFKDLKTDKGKPMYTLNGEIILERDWWPDGRLKGVVSVHPDALAAMLPELKNDIDDKMGYKKYLDKWRSDGVEDIFEGVADPTPDEYELSAAEELATLDIGSMSDYEAKQKLIALQAKARMGT